MFLSNHRLISDVAIGVDGGQIEHSVLVPARVMPQFSSVSSVSSVMPQFSVLYYSVMPQFIVLQYYKPVLCPSLVY